MLDRINKFILKYIYNLKVCWTAVSGPVCFSKNQKNYFIKRNKSSKT